MNEEQLLQTLDQLQMRYQRFEHPAVYTCEESQRLCPPMPGLKNKNLFFRDRKGKQYFLVSLAQDKNLSIKEIANLIGQKNISFASEERLFKVLGVQPGSVGILDLINDTEQLSQLYIDQELLNEEWLQSHPLVNTSTVAFATSDLQKFLQHTGHRFTALQLNQKTP